MDLSESLVQKCMPYIGKTRLDAADLLNKKPLVLTVGEFRRVFLTAMSVCVTAGSCIGVWIVWMARVMQCFRLSG